MRVLLLTILVSQLASSQTADPLAAALREGDKALAERRYSDAELAFDKARQLAPGLADIYGRLGLVRYQQGKYEAAVPALRQGLKLNPALPRADILLAMSLSELGRFPEALPGLQKGFRASEPEIRRMSGLQLQRAYSSLGRDRDAVEVALGLARTFPDDPEVLYHSARLFGNFAFLNMRKLAAVAPESPWRYLASGEVYESEGKYDLAVAAYRQVLQSSPGRPGVHLRIGRVLLAGRDANAETAAQKEFESELQIDPTNANAAYELGELLRRRGDFVQARELLERAVKGYPDFDEAHIALGRVLLAAKQPEKAVDHLRRAATAVPGNAVAWFHLARAWEDLGNVAEQKRALAEYRRIQSETLKQRQIGMRTFSAQEPTPQDVDTASPRR